MSDENEFNGNGSDLEYSNAPDVPDPLTLKNRFHKMLYSVSSQQKNFNTGHPLSPDTQDTKDAIMAIIRKENRFMLIKRGETIPAAGFWCPVSGKVKVGETQPETVAREVKEEIGLEVKALKKVHESLTNNKLYRLHWWTTEIKSGDPEIQNHEVAEMRWLTREELKALHPVFEEDIEILLNVNDDDFR